MAEQKTDVTATIGAEGTGGRLITGDGRALPLRGVTLSGDARGGLARVVLTQRFVNPHAEALRVRREALIEEAAGAWRQRGSGPVRFHPAWADLDPAGLSTTARAVLARIGG